MRLSVLAILCLGCAAPKHLEKDSAVVEIVSDPPGARILFDGDYVGDAPMFLEIEIAGTFAAEIQAIPKENGYVQKQWIDSWSRIPRRIFFDTALGPAVRDHSVDLRLLGEQ